MKRLFRRKMKGGKEFDYKSGSDGPRYISKFKRVKRSIPLDHTDEHPPKLEDIEEVVTIINQIIEKAKKFEQYEEIRDEHLLLCVRDLSNMRISILADKGKVELHKGQYEKKDPSIVLPIRVKNLKGMLEFIEDEVIDKKELFIMIRFFAIPVLMDLYDQRILYIPGNKWRYKFDDFIQIEILPDKPISMDGELLNIQIIQ